MVTKREVKPRRITKNKSSEVVKVKEEESVEVAFYKLGEDYFTDNPLPDGVIETYEYNAKGDFIAVLKDTKKRNSSKASKRIIPTLCFLALTVTLCVVTVFMFYPDGDVDVTVGDNAIYHINGMLELEIINGINSDTSIKVMVYLEDDVEPVHSEELEAGASLSQIPMNAIGGALPQSGHVIIRPKQSGKEEIVEFGILY